MMKIYALLRGDASVEDVLKTARTESSSSQRASALFYAHLYIGCTTKGMATMNWRAAYHRGRRRSPSRPLHVARSARPRAAPKAGRIAGDPWPRRKLARHDRQAIRPEIAEFLSGNTFCRIGCLDEEGWPYVVPCWFEYGDGGFYIIPGLAQPGRATSAGSARLALHRRIDPLQPPRPGQGQSRSPRRAKRRRTMGGNRTQDVAPLSGRAWPRISRTDARRAPLVAFRPPVKMKTWQGVDWHQRYKHAAW